MRKHLSVILFFVITISTLQAGDPFASNHGFINIELGPLNAKARTHAAYTEYDDNDEFVANHPATNELEITELSPGILADAGLLVGDKIIKANDIDFTIEKRPAIGTEPREAFGTALWQSAHTTERTLQLLVKRGDNQLNFNITVPTYPSDQEQLLKVCDDIVRTAEGNGNFGGKVVGEMLGLVLLASGEEKYQQLVKKKADYLVRNYEEDAEDITSNWKLVYIGTFLGEYYLATGDESVVDALKWCGHKLAIHSNGMGCVSHSGINSTTYSENPYGIRGMSIITTQMLMVFNLMEKAGLLTDPFDIAARDETENSLLDTVKTSSGAVDYIIGRRTNFSDSQGRPAKFALAMALTDKLDSAYGRRASEWLVTKKTQLLYGHAASFCGFWASISALHTIKPGNWESAVSYYDWFKALSVAPENYTDPIVYIPGRQNPGGDGYLGRYSVAQAHTGFMAALAAETSKLHIHGGREKNWYKVDGVNAHLVDVQTGVLGSATPSYKLYNSGDNATVTITPNSGYKVASIRSKDGFVNYTGDPNTQVTVTFSNIQKSQKLAVVFAKQNESTLRDINGLALHFDASELTTDQTVGFLRDLSGFDQPARQNSVSKQPILAKATINGRSTLQFTGTEYLEISDVTWQDLLETENNGVTSTWYFVTTIDELMKSRPYSDNDDHSYCLWGNYSSSSTHFGVYVDQYGFRSGMHGTTTSDGPRITCPENQPVLLEAIFNNGDLTLTMHHAGGQSSPVSVTMGQPRSADNLNYSPHIGRRTKSNISNYFRGKLGELMIYNELLNETDRQEIRSHLIEKWIPATSHAILTSLNTPGQIPQETFDPYKIEYTYNLLYGEADLDLTQLTANTGATIHPDDLKRYSVSDFPEEGGVVQVRVTSENGNYTRTYKINVNITPRILNITTTTHATASPATQAIYYNDSGSAVIFVNDGYKVTSVRDNNGYVNYSGNPAQSITLNVTNLAVNHQVSVVTEEIETQGLPDIPDLALHLDTSWIVGENNSSIMSWQDFSGQPGSIKQETTEDQPILTPNGINNRPTLKFSDEQNLRFDRRWESFVANSETGINSTWFFVVKTDVPGFYDSSDDDCQQIFGDYGNRDFGLYADDKGFRAAVSGDVTKNGPRVAFTTGEPALVEVKFNSGDVTLNVYGAEGLRGTQTVTMGNLAVVESLQNKPHFAREGKYYWNNFWQGQMGEVIIYKSALTDNECSQVRNYLVPKWLPPESNSALNDLNIANYQLNQPFSPYQDTIYELVISRGGEPIDLSQLTAANGGTIDPSVLREYYPSDFDNLTGEIMIPVTSKNGTFTRNYRIRLVPDRVLYWNFNDSVDDTVEDQWPNQFDGSVIGASWTDGVKGGGLQFDGVDDSIDINLDDISPPCSISFWLKREYSDNGSTQLLKSTDHTIFLSTWYRSRRLAFEDNENDQLHKFSYKAPENIWNNIVMTCDGETTDLYINGLLQESAEQPLYIPLTTMGNFKGTIDELKIYRRVLKGAEIKNNAVINSAGMGYVTEELWYDINGGDLTDLINHINFPDSADRTKRATELKFTETGSNFGRKVSGFIHPPTTGTYRFYISADDSAELWLSSGEDAERIDKVAYLTSWSNVDEWDKYPSQQSVGIYLTAEKKYYFEIRHKEDGGGDHVSVAWDGPNFARQIIDGRFLSESNLTRPQLKLTIDPGWNLLSLPSATFNLKPLLQYGIFWTFNESSAYEQVARPDAMQGFWLFSDGSQPEEIVLYSVDYMSDTFHSLHTGWNLAGPRETGKLTKRIPLAFYWDSELSRYCPVAEEDNITPGVGYWLFNFGADSLDVLLP